MTSKSPAATSLSDKPLKDLTVIELKALCKERGIKGFAHKSKARLLEMVQAASKTSADAVADPSSEPRPSKSRVTQKPKAKKPKAKTPASNDQQGDFTSLTIIQLKQLCKDQGIKGFARKNKQQLLELIRSMISPDSLNNHPEVNLGEKEKSQDSGDPEMKDPPMGEEDSDQLSSEDLDANLAGQGELADKSSRAELDAVREDFEDQRHGDTEETMVVTEVSDRLIFEVLDRFDRIEALLQRIAKMTDNS